MAAPSTSSVITLEFLQDLLRDTEPGVQLLSFQVAPGTGRGDNYTAMLYRVQLNGVRDRGPETAAAWRRSLICKVLPSSAARRQAFKSDMLFRNEVAFYTRALPALLRFQASVPSSTAPPATPRCYRALDDAVVLEDLRDRGFLMADRRQGLDRAHLQAALSEVARFHAVSLAMKASDPKQFAAEVSGAVRETIFAPGNEEWYRDYYRIATRNAVAMLREGLPAGAQRNQCEAAATNFLLDDRFFSRMAELVQPSEPFAVLCHGDCWTNNFLFRYNASHHIEEVVLLDFQMSRYGSPCLDLSLLLFCCTERELRAAHLDGLLRHYHHCLLDALHQLGCTSPAYAQPDTLWDMLCGDMQRLGRFTLGLAVDYLPVITCDPEAAPDVYESAQEASAEEAPPVFSLPSSERCVQRMCDLVLDLHDRGALAP